MLRCLQVQAVVPVTDASTPRSTRNCGPGSSEWVLLSLEISAGDTRGEAAVLASPLREGGNRSPGLAVVTSRQGRVRGTESKDKSLEAKDNKPTIKTGSEPSCSL